MSLDVLTAIWRDPPCKGGDLLCLLAIADNADENGFAWPSIQTIARKAAMGERGAQKCVQKLAQAGLIHVEQGGGRNKTNAYQITTNGIGDAEAHQNPEQNTLNKVHPLEPINPEQSCINPEPAFAKPRTSVHPNSQEPSKEPVLAILLEFVSEGAALGFIDYRKRNKKHGRLTENGARLLANLLSEISKAGYDADDALAMAELRGWASVNLEWYRNAGGKKVSSAQAASPNNSIEAIKSGKRFLCTNISDQEASQLVAANHVTAEQCRAVGLHP